MDRFKIILLFLILIVMVSAVGCGHKEKNTETDAVNNKTVSQAEPSLHESTSTAAITTASGVNESQNTPQSITVISKSDSTIAQAEKKKVLDDLSVEIDSLIDEVNKDASSQGKLE